MSWRRIIDVRDDGKRMVDWPRLIVLLLGCWVAFGILDNFISEGWFLVGVVIAGPPLIALDIWLRRKP